MLQLITKSAYVIYEWPLRKSGPWMTKSEIDGTHSARYMNYETEEPYINRNDPIVSGMNIPGLDIGVKWVKI